MVYHELYLFFHLIFVFVRCNAFNFLFEIIDFKTCMW